MKTQKKAAAEVLQTAEEERHGSDSAVTVPTQTPLSEPVESEKRYSVSFNVEGTLLQLKALKAFLVDGGYAWNTIK